MTDFTIDTDILSLSQTLSPKYNLYSSPIPGNTISSGIALEIAGRVVEKEIDPARHEKLIEEFISGLGDAS